MSTPVVARLAGWSRRALCAAIALALSMSCIVLAVAASTTPMTGMADMAETSVTAAPTVAVGAYTSGLTDGAIDVISEAASPVASVMAPPMSSLCDSACVMGASQMYAVAAGLAVTSLLALLLASRRDTFMGVLERTRPRARPRRRRPQTPWTVLSPISLCVLRV